jgi:hypothetical protein
MDTWNNAYQRNKQVWTITSKALSAKYSEPSTTTKRKTGREEGRRI